MQIQKLSQTTFPNALSLMQSALHNKIPSLFLFEVDSIFTTGRRKKETQGVLKLSRGGCDTYHGPGQLIAFPVVDISTIGGTKPKFLIP